MRSWDAPADRGNKLLTDKGLGHQSGGPAGDVTSLRAIDRDTRAIVTALLARGISVDQVAVRTGASMQVVRVVQAAARSCPVVDPTIDRLREKTP